MEESETVDRNFLKTLARGLDLIKSFGNDTPGMTLSEVARKNGMSRASARRFLITLQKLGYVIKSGDHFQLTAKILEIGHQYLANLNFVEVITPLMREVSRNLNKSCSASVLDGSDIIYIVRIPSRHQILSVTLNIGSRLPAYCTSMGRVLLGNLSDRELDEYFRNTEIIARTSRTITDTGELRKIIKKVKRDGYCIVNQELEENLCSIAVPVRNGEGRILCAINLGMPVGQDQDKEIRSGYLPTLKKAAIRAEELLAHYPH